MAFNFSKAKLNAVKDLTNTKLGVLVLGAGGDGKSTLCGTFEGRTLFLYCQGESHGARSASTMGGQLDAIRLDLDDDENRLTPDQTYDRLIAILSDAEGVRQEGYGAVVLDSLSDMESVIRATTKFKIACMTDKGGHNKFAEPQAVIDLFRPILVKLKDLQLNVGIHFACTCPLDVQSKEDNGEISEAKPKLSTYSVAESLVLQFADIITVGRMTNDKGKAAHRIQFGSNISKESKNQDGTIKKLMNFSPRLAGVLELPPHMVANMSKLAELKEKGASK
jgi:hypothetical protein